MKKSLLLLLALLANSASALMAPWEPNEDSPTASENTAPSVAEFAPDEATTARLDEAKAAYDHKDYAKVLEIVQPLAEAGKGRAQNYLGLLYAQGLGVKQDYSEARRWYERAAAAGDVSALNNLGYLYVQGLGVKQDYDRARFWFEHAHNAEAMSNLGVFYEQGWGVARDKDKAEYFYMLAAAGGESKAQRNLARLYLLMGLGGKQDSANTQEWLVEAADGGEFFASLALGYFYQNGLEECLEDYWEKDLNQARKWYSRAAVQGWR